MGTQHVYSRSLAGFLFLVALVALCCGGCGKTVSRGGPAFEPAWSEPCVVNSEGVAGESDEGTLTVSDEPAGDMAEAGVLGYSDPAAGEGMPTPFVTEDGYMPEQIGDADASSSEQVTPWMANWGEDRMEAMDEESNVEMNESGEPGDYQSGMYEETPWTPPVTEQEYTPEPTGDTEGEYTPEPTTDLENDGSDTVVPYLNGENETTTGGGCFDVTSDGFGTATMNGMSWMWANNTRLVLNPWWQAMITGGHEIDVPRYEAYLPGMLRDVDTSESSYDPEARPSP